MEIVPFVIEINLYYVVELYKISQIEYFSKDISVKCDVLS